MIMRLTLNIAIILVILMTNYSCRKKEDTTVIFSVVNKTGFIIDTLEVFSNEENPYDFKYFNIKNNEQTNKETVYNASSVVRFILRYDNQSSETSCYPPGIIDPTDDVGLKRGSYVFYLIAPDSASNYIPVAYTYEGF